MRPILVNIPAKPLLVAALVVAAVMFVRDLVLRRRDPSRPLGSLPLYLVIGAAILYRMKAGTLIPSAAGFALDWDPLPIHAYGVMLGTSLFVGWFLAMRLAQQDGVPQQQAGTIYMWTALWSIIGSRILWFFTDPAPHESVFDLFKIWQGGLVAYGGMIGGFLASWYGCWKRKIPLLKWADVSAPAVVLGTAITRIGCFLFGCDYGAPSNVPWAVRFPGRHAEAAHELFPFSSPHGSPAWQHHVSPPLDWQQHFNKLPLPSSDAWSYSVHPTQLYESLVGLLLFGLLMLIRRHRRFSGQVFLGWVLGYGIMRPLIEIVRDDDDRGVYTFMHLSLSTSQIIGIVSVVLGLILLVQLVRKYRRDPEGSRLWLQPAAVGPDVAAAAPAAEARAARGGGAKGKRRKRR
jgi:prolipoprotein diacylglyceryl transferase